MDKPPTYTNIVENPRDNSTIDEIIQIKDIEIKETEQVSSQPRSSSLPHVTTTKSVQTWNTRLFQPRRKLFLKSIFCPCVLFGKTSELSRTGTKLYYCLIYIFYSLVNVFCFASFFLHVYEKYAVAHYTEEKVGEIYRPRCYPLPAFGIQICNGMQKFHQYEIVVDDSKGKYLLRKIIETMNLRLPIIVCLFVMNNLLFVGVRVKQRIAIRRSFGIYGSFTEDLLTVSFLGCFALSQEASQVGVIAEKGSELELEKVPDYEDVVQNL